jgi:hypothetical protein
VIPLGAVSIGFIMIQPVMLGALCALCMVQALVTVILIPFSIDEVLATMQFLMRSYRAGRPFWRTLFMGGAGFAEQKDASQRLDLPFAKLASEFATGGVQYPWTLVASSAIGAAMLATPLIVHTEPPLYFSDHVAGCLIFAISVTALAEPARLLRLLNVPVGLWLAASPFFLSGGTLASGTVDLVAGLGLLALSLPRGARSEEQYGGWNRFIL